VIIYQEEEVMLREALELSTRYAILGLPVLLLSLWWNGVPVFRILIAVVAVLALLFIGNLAILYVTRWRRKRASIDENV
jgi:membrane protein YdbS with pleckstrin-like domain